MTLTNPKSADAVARGILGMNVREAEANIAEAGFTSRVVVIHGAGIPGVGEQCDTRIKLWVNNDEVYRAQVG